jgi:hypothetical protein
MERNIMSRRPGITSLLHRGGIVSMIGGILVAACLPLPAQPPRPAPPNSKAAGPGAPAVKAEEELVDKVRKAIERGVKYLKSQQRDGNWEGVVLNVLADMEGGVTALATLALLTSGVPPDDPAVAKALDYLRSLPPRKTYVVGLQTMVFAEARQKRDLPLIQRNADWLIRQGVGWQIDERGRVVGGQLRGWSYPAGPSNMADNSNTQYALLGLYAAKQAGATIDPTVWREIRAFYTRTQKVEGPMSGSWSYATLANIGGMQPSLSMTVAGVCGLYIASMGLDESEQQLDPQTGVAANCGVYSENQALTRGLNWVASHFNFDSPKSSFYNVYGIERLGRLSGERFIGRHDWYREGCQWLITRQEPSGAIVGKGGIDAAPIISTSFALLFLAKGRTPVLISKWAWGDFQFRNGMLIELSLGDSGQVNWNRKHNDVRNIVEFCSRELFEGVPLSWQVYDARRLSFDNDFAPGGRSSKEKILEEVGVLLQSPVLYINGHGRIVGGRGSLSAAQKEILKTYIEEGGFILAEACCGDPEFAASFKELMQELFPENTFRRLPPEHAIWSILPGITPLDFPDLEVLERGCRTVCVFSPKPLAGYWEEAKYMPKDSRRPSQRGEKAFCLARNIVAYATGLELPKPKLTRTQVVAKGAETGVTRSHFRAAQLDVGDRPAPDALKNLMAFLRDQARLDVAQTSVVLPPGDEQLFLFKFMYLHGRKPLQLSDVEIETLQANLNSGGLLFVDAACNGMEAWKAFDRSFRDLCRRLYPNQQLVIIESQLPDGREEPLFRLAREAGIDLRTVRCRREKADGSGPEIEMRTYPVLLEGIQVDGRWVVIYSKYDVGCAIEGHKAADCLGHDKESALRIAAAVVLYSLKR